MFRSTVGILAALAVSSMLSAAPVVYNATLQDNGTIVDVSPFRTADTTGDVVYGGWELQVGSVPPDNRVGIIKMQLPTLAANETVTGVTFTFTEWPWAIATLWTPIDLVVYTPTSGTMGHSDLLDTTHSITIPSVVSAQFEFPGAIAPTDISISSNADLTAAVQGAYLRNDSYVAFRFQTQGDPGLAPAGIAYRQLYPATNTLQITADVVPEPASIGLLTAVTGLLALRRRR